jgi:hypothetical protein
VLGVPALRVDDERAGPARLPDHRIDRVDHPFAAGDGEAAARVGEVVLQVHDDERRARVVSGHVSSIAVMAVRVRVLVSGRVQGVFFRASCAEEARRLGVGGWVRNRPDGRVEAVFEGDQSQVSEMVEW